MDAPLVTTYFPDEPKKADSRVHAVLSTPRCGGFCTTCGLLCCAGANIVGLIVLLTVLFAVTPQVLSMALRNANVEVREMRITHFGKFAHVSPIGVAMDGVVGSGLPVHAHVAPTDVRVAFGGEEFMKVPFPALALEAGTGAAVSVTNDALVTDAATFCAFASSILNNANASVELRADVSISAFGMTWHGVKMATPLVLPGMSKFAASPPRVLSYDVTGTTEDTISMVATVSMPNPSTVGFNDFGELQLIAAYDGVPLGVASVHNATMLPGVDNVLNSSITIRRTPANHTGRGPSAKGNAAAIASVLSAAINGVPASLALSGFPGSTDVELLRCPLQSLSAPVEMLPLPAMPLMRIAYGVLPLDWSDPTFPQIKADSNATLCDHKDSTFPELDHSYVDASIEMSNPLSVPVTLRTLTGAGGWEGEPDSAAFPGGCSAGDFGPMLTTPIIAVDYNFTLDPKASTAIFSSQLCLGDAQATYALLPCYGHDVDAKTWPAGEGMLDHSGHSPLVLRMRLTGNATGSVGNFSIRADAPLEVLRTSLPLVAHPREPHCKNASQTWPDCS